MVKDRTNQYYTELLEYMQGTPSEEFPQTYPKLTGGMKYSNTPPSFPWMYMTQIDGRGTAYTLSNGENAISLAYQIEFYDKESLGRCRLMANKAREWLVGTGFQITYFNPVDNVSDRSINRFVIRVTKFES